MTIRNPIQAVSEFNGGVMLVTPLSGSRRVKSVRIISTGKVVSCPVAVDISRLLGVMYDFKESDIEIIDGETDAEHTKRIAEKDEPNQKHLYFHEKDLPIQNGSCMFQEAWRLVGGKVTVDMAVVRNLVRGKVRAQANYRFSVADVDNGWLGDDPKAAAYRNALRGMLNKLSLDGLTLLELWKFQPAWPTV